MMANCCQQRTISPDLFPGPGSNLCSHTVSAGGTRWPRVEVQPPYAVPASPYVVGAVTLFYVSFTNVSQISQKVQTKNVGETKNVGDRLLTITINQCYSP